MLEKKVQVKKIEKINSSKVKLSSEYGEDSIKELENRIIKKYCKKAVIPGFRPGKAPKTLVEERYKEKITEELISELLRNGLVDSLEQTGFTPITEPELIFTDLEHKEDGRVFAFEANFEVLPEIVLGNYKKIPITRIELSVSEEEVDTNINALRENLAVLEPTEMDRGANGFFGIVDMTYEIKNGSQKKEEINKLVFEFGGKKLFPELEDALSSMKVGEEKEVLVRIPKDFQNKELADKEVLYTCKLLEIKKKVLPPLDDSFASQVKEGATLNELRENIHKNLLNSKREDARKEHCNQITDYLISQHSFEPPDSMVEKETKRLVDRIYDRMKHYTGREPAQLTDEEMAEIRKRAEKIVKGSLILREIAAKEGIEVEKSLVEEKTNLAMSYIKEPLPKQRMEQLRKVVFNEVHSQLLTERVYDFLIENAEEMSNSPQGQM